MCDNCLLSEKNSFRAHPTPSIIPIGSIPEESLIKETDQGVESTVDHKYKNDLGDYDLKNLIRDEQFFLANNHFKPPEGYSFPYTEKKSRGRIEKLYASNRHLDKFKWLVFSDKAQGYFCLPCALFLNKSSVNNSVGGIQVGKLVSEPLTKFDKILDKLSNHDQCKYHTEQVLILANFIKTYKNPSKNIVNIMEIEKQKKVAENREALGLIIETIIFCGIQNIALRGHRDSGELIESGENSGNFRALLLYREKGGDSKLKNLSLNRTCHYISPRIQNELIEIIGNKIQASILKQITSNNSPYSIIFDETPDISKKEQLSLVLRYVSSDFEVQEQFIGFFDCYEEAKSLPNFKGSLTGVVIGEVVLKILKRLNLNLKFLVSISTDTASVMASTECGAVSQIKKQAEHSIHSPCLNHILNLALKGTCQQPNVSIVMDTIESIYSFFKYFFVIFFYFECISKSY